MKKIFLALATIASANTFATTGDSPWTEVQNNKNYCEATGGKIVTLQAQFDTHSGYINGLSKEFCQYISKKNIAVVGLETLSKTSNIAATLTQNLKIDDNKPLPTKPYNNPSLNVCQLLHGTQIAYLVVDGGFADNNGQYDICVFGDGSSISAWTLIYAAAGIRKDIKSLIQSRSKPLEIDIPDIQPSAPQ